MKLEAIIGIFYAVSSALTDLFISKTPHGQADIQEVLFGNLLGVTQGDLIKMGVVFGALAVIRVIWYRRIFQITHEYENHQLEGGRSFLLWKIFFYLSIVLAIVFAIEVGGVIPVFSFIIVPPVIVVILVKKESFVVSATLLCAIVTSYFGLYFSYRWDFPTSASIVTTLGVLVLITGMVKFIRSLVVHQEQRV
ncbi:MAG: metal ABC transporter permease [Candidatus Marinimicrobia bacterium]|nr:metal ABC transporter permease [Candidatus Neomarinimicrobiota bacterium]